MPCGNFGFRQHVIEHAKLTHPRHSRSRIGQAQQVEHLHADPLAREAFQCRCKLGAGAFRLAISRQGTEASLKAEIAQDPQVILADALVGIADEAQAPCLKVGDATEPVEHLKTVRVGIERVHREIAPRRIVLPIMREGDGSAAAIGRDVMAQGGDLYRPAMQHGGDSAVFDAGRHIADAGSIEPPDHLLRHQRGRNVDVLHLDAEQGVAHGSTNIARVAGTERVDERAQVFALGPVGGGQVFSHAS
jgi:hypothetical protein